MPRNAVTHNYAGERYGAKKAENVYNQALYHLTTTGFLHTGMLTVSYGPFARYEQDAQ